MSDTFTASTSRPPHGWLSLHYLREQFQANLAALALRDRVLATEVDAIVGDVCVRTSGNLLQIADRRPSGEFILLPNSLPAVSAAEVASKLCPNGVFHQPILIAGLDQGWLWRQLYEMPTAVAAAPGHRPPLYLACSDLSRLWIILHLHDLRNLFTDPRVFLFAGNDPIGQLTRHLIAHPEIPLPRLSVTVDPTIWTDGQSLDTVLGETATVWDQEFNGLRKQLEAIDSGFNPVAWAANVQAGRPLRILGITSRFTTFLQYSMRDWLEAFSAMGHETKLVIESADHEMLHPLTTVRAVVEHRPDLIVMIDHCRAEMTGLPQAIPFVMWVQDRLPHIFRSSTGERQAATDYAIGQGRTECVHSFRYPSTQFMPAMIGTNPRRFCSTGKELGTPCEVSFVSHCSLPAETIVASEIARLNSPQAKQLLSSIFDQLRAVYDAGDCITQPYRIESIIRQALLDTRTSVADTQPLLDLFTHRINNSLFRHQAIGWVADMDVDLHLYGRGWESHPRFARFARGAADNESQLAGIYRASAINLQITPFGAAHQRLFDGLAAGGFFLLRRTHGDRFDQILRQLWNWCVEHNVSCDTQLREKADGSVRQWIAQLDEIDNKPVLGRGYDFVSEVAVNAAEGFIRSAGTIWPEFEQISFEKNDEIQLKISHFLDSPAERRDLRVAMQEPVLRSLTYTALNRRMLRFIAADLSKKATRTTEKEIQQLMVA